MLTRRRPTEEVGFISALPVGQRLLIWRREPGSLSPLLGRALITRLPTGGCGLGSERPGQEREAQPPASGEQSTKRTPWVCLVLG